MKSISWLFRLFSTQAFRDLVVAGLIAFLLILPLTGWSFLPQHGPEHLYLSVASDEEHYAAITREVSEGKWLHRNPYLFEEKQGTPTIYMWSEVFLGQLLKIWPFGIAWFVLFIKWIGCSLGLWYLMRITKALYPQLSLSWQITAALGFLILPAFLGFDILDRISQALGFYGFWSEGLAGLRFVNPVVTHVLLLGWIEMFLRYLRSPHSKALWRTGIGLGALIWFYIYFWMFASVLVGLTVIHAIYKGHHTEVKKLIRILLMSSLVFIPYFLFVYWQTSHSHLRVALPVHTREPLISLAVISVFIGFGLWRLWQVKRTRAAWRETDIFLFLCALASLVATNQHVLTGITLQPHHFYFFISLPLAGWFVMLWLSQIASTYFPRWSNKLGGCLGACIFLLGIGVQFSTVHQVRAEFIDRLRLTPAFAWIQRQADPMVIYADNRASELVPMYTKADVYSSLHATVYESNSHLRRERAWFVESRLSGLTEVRNIFDTFQKQREIIGCRIFECQYWRDQCGSYGCFPDDYLHGLVQKYTDFLKKDFVQEWQAYRVDFVLWDERLHPEWQLERYPFLQKIWSGDQVSFWRFVTSTPAL